uniref:uncharacterized protein LOC120342596 isoform X2 n=1 Tax=Styela clava TaxID=7725 RepID=UPI0019399FC5|nr:uncharacterized protein LOC120342596 isoform X2 [Styela clava]
MEILKLLVVVTVFLYETYSEDTFAVDKELVIFPNVTNIEFDVGGGARYQVVVCYSCSNESQVAWYEGNNLVENDTSRNYYQIYEISTGEPYPASLAVSHNETIHPKYLTCKEMNNNICGNEITVFVVSSDVKSNITLISRPTSNSTDVLCYSKESIDVSWWHYDKDEVTFDSSSSIYQNHTMINGYQSALLDVKYATKSDSGCFTCKEIYNEDEGTVCLEFPDFVTIHLFVYPPEENFIFDKSVENILSISCILSDIKSLPLYWYKEGDVIPTDQSLSVFQDISAKTTILNILIDVGFSEGGVYECIAANQKVDEKKTIEIEIKGVYSLYLDPDVSKVNIISGKYPEHDVIITCYSEDDVTLSWYTNGKLIDTDSERPVHQSIGPKQYSQSLVISKATGWSGETTLAGGEYICKRTTHANTEKIVILEVFSGESTNLEIDEMSNSAATIFTCSAPNISSSTLRWYKDGVLITSDSSSNVFQLQSGTITSVLSNLILSHDESVPKGEYSCIVSGIGTTKSVTNSTTADFRSINYQGHFVIMLSESEKSIKIDRALPITEIECSSSDTGQQIVWYKDGDQIQKDSSLTIYQTYSDSGNKSKSVLSVTKSVLDSKSGVYECAAIVADGIKTREIYIHIDLKENDTSPVGLIVTTTILFVVVIILIILLRKKCGEKNRVGPNNDQATAVINQTNPSTSYDNPIVTSMSSIPGQTDVEDDDNSEKETISVTDGRHESTEA